MERKAGKSETIVRERGKSEEKIKRCRKGRRNI